MKKEKSIQELLEFGILSIDKPAGPTSFDVSDFIRNKLDLRKTSHFGTLDPRVTGVLPIALNRACKLTGYFLKKDKEYVGIMHLHKDIDEKKLQGEIQNFIGKIMQKPPIKSRVKRVEREREIYSLEILEFDRENKNVLFQVSCEAGTYIRKLIDDLGKKIGGAHMQELRRIKAGIFSEKDDSFVNLYDFVKAVNEWKINKNEEELIKIIIPAEQAIKKVFLIVEVNREAVDKLLHGSPLFSEYLARKYSKLKINEKIAVFCDEQFIGIYNIINDKKTGIFAKPEFVLQPINV